MSKERATIIFAHSENPVNEWNKAISDAERMINEAQGRIAQLRRAVKGFKKLRDKGEPFPSERAEQQRQDVQ